ncbi:hypothetical protein ACQCQP_26635, partial [Ralstonia pseudosolanacearum]|uniref:hypothetical protein n=1 Tax=Ralstonia pseudosolanacearum TaxID=1310165 RepID=UPI003CF5AEE5
VELCQQSIEGILNDLDDRFESQLELCKCLVNSSADLAEEFDDGSDDLGDEILYGAKEVVEEGIDLGKESTNIEVVEYTFEDSSKTASKIGEAAGNIANKTSKITGKITASAEWYETVDCGNDSVQSADD